MKKLFLFAVLFISAVIGFSQVGIGSLKLGMKVSDIPILSKSDTTSSYDYYIRRIYRNKSIDCVYEFLHEDTSKYYSKGSVSYGLISLSPNTRKFYIGRLKISNLIEIENVELLFYKDSLYQIHCNRTSDLEDAIKVKFGEPKTTVTTKDHTFVNGYGNRFIKTDETFLSEYNTLSDNIILTSTLSKYYNDNGEANYISFVVLYNLKINDIVYSEDKSERNRLEKNIEKNKRKSLSDF